MKIHHKQFPFDTELMQRDKARHGPHIIRIVIKKKRLTTVLSSITLVGSCLLSCTSDVVLFCCGAALLLSVIFITIY